MRKTSILLIIIAFTCLLSSASATDTDLPNMIIFGSKGLDISLLFNTDIINTTYVVNMWLVDENPQKFWWLKGDGSMTDVMTSEKATAKEKAEILANLQSYCDNEGNLIHLDGNTVQGDNSDPLKSETTVTLPYGRNFERKIVTLTPPVVDGVAYEEIIEFAQVVHDSLDETYGESYPWTWDQLYTYEHSNPELSPTLEDLDNRQWYNDELYEREKQGLLLYYKTVDTAGFAKHLMYNPKHQLIHTTFYPSPVIYKEHYYNVFERIKVADFSLTIDMLRWKQPSDKTSRQQPYEIIFRERGDRIDPHLPAIKQWFDYLFEDESATAMNVLEHYLYADADEYISDRRTFNDRDIWFDLSSSGGLQLDISVKQ